MTDEAEPYTQDEIEELGESFDALHPLFSALLSDIRTLSAKKPEGLLNDRKIKTVNRILTDALVLLKREPSYRFLELIDADDIPQYSDVAIMLGQFDAALDAFKDRYHSYSGGWQAEFAYEDDEDGEDDDEDDDGEEEASHST